MKINNVIFKFATTQNIDDIVQFELMARKTEDIFISIFDEFMYRELLKKANLEKQNNNKIILAYLNDLVIGRIDLIIFYSLMDFCSMGYIDWIYVLKDYRGNSIGKLLIKKAEAYFISQGINEYYLFTASNQEAQRFYHNQDFKFENREVATRYI